MNGISDMSALRAEMREAITAAPLCRDCEYRRWNMLGGHGQFCRRPLKPTFDLINGDQKVSLCEPLTRERGRTSLLDRLFGRIRSGPRGLYFKPRERPSTPPPPCGGSAGGYPSASSASPRDTKTAAKYRTALRKIARIDDPAGDAGKFGFTGLAQAQDIARKALK